MAINLKITIGLFMIVVLTIALLLAGLGLPESQFILLGGAIIAVEIVVAIYTWQSLLKPIGRIINSIHGEAEQLSISTEQLLRNNQQLASSVHSQASSLEEFSSSLEELSSMTRQNADNAGEANKLSANTQNDAEQGQDAMSIVNDVINQIKGSADQMAKIIKTIDEIAFQTNLLALNAAVEAARAGEAGKGFAVVAEEVRNLAQRSAGAARDTSSLIEESQQSADNGVAVIEQLALHFEQIVQGTKKTSQFFGEVTAASDEQARGIAQINQGVVEMDKMMQTNAAISETTASTSSMLRVRISKLSETIDQLESMFGIDSSGRRDTVRPASSKTSFSRRAANGLPSTKSLKSRPEPTPETQAGHLEKKRIIKPEEIIPLNDTELEDF